MTNKTTYTAELIGTKCRMTGKTKSEAMTRLRRYYRNINATEHNAPSFKNAAEWYGVKVTENN
jgi:hypothetical protein